MPGEVGAAEGIFHAEIDERILQRAIEADVDARQPELAVAAFVFLGETRDGVGIEDGQHVIDGLALGRQDDDLAHGLSLAERQSDDLVVLPVGRVDHRAVLVHGGDVADAGEGEVLGERLVELREVHSPLKPDAVDGEHHRIRADRLEHLVDLLVGPFVDEAVDDVEGFRSSKSRSSSLALK